jgi:hypothetical protein
MRGGENYFFWKKRCQRKGLPYTPFSMVGNRPAGREKIGHFIPPRSAGKSGGIKAAAVSCG